MHSFIVGTATLKGYRLGFYRRSQRRNCGVLDIVEDATRTVEGVLYCLPLKFSHRLDEREEVPRGGYRQHWVDVTCQGKTYQQVRTYVVVNKLDRELAPNDWYFNVVLRGAVTCGISETYCWQLFEHMYQLQRQPLQPNSNRGMRSTASR
jgi:cation transport regulator ChaC